MKTDNDLLQENNQLLNKLLELMTTLLGILNPKAEETTDELDRKSFNAQRWWKTVGLTVLLFGITAYFYALGSVLFILPFSFFVAASAHLFLLVVDLFFTKGDTFARIEQNSIATALYVCAIAFIIWAGLEAGRAITPESFQNEAAEKSVIEQRYDNSSSGWDADGSSSGNVPGTSESSDESTGTSGIPNR